MHLLIRLLFCILIYRFWANATSACQQNLAVTTTRQNQLIMERIKPDAPDPVRMVTTCKQSFLNVPRIPNFQRAVVTARHQVTVFVGIAVEVSNQLPVGSVDSPGTMIRITNVVRSNAAVIECNKLIALVVLRPLACGEFRCVLGAHLGNDASLGFSPLMK